MSKPFHYDYFCLKQTNPEDWYRDFFWPIPRETTTRITEDFKKFQCALINRLGNTFEGDCLVIAYHISGKFTEVVNHYVSLNRLETAGYSVVPSPGLKLIPLLQQKNTPVEFSYENLMKSSYTLKNSVRNTVNTFKLNFRKSNFSLFDHFIPGKATYAFSGVANSEYALNIDDWIRITSSGQMLDPNPSGQDIPDKSKAFIMDVTDEFMRFTESYTSENFGVRIPTNIAKGLREYCAGYLAKVATAYYVLTRKVSRCKISKILCSTAGNPYTRAMGLAVMKTGGQAFGFPHGYFICHYSGSRVGFHELSTVNNFVTYFPSSIPLFQRNIEMNPLPRNHKVSLVTEKSPVLKKIHEKWKDKPLSKKIKTVMILELSMIPEWAAYYAAEAMVNYHFYYNLCSTLSRNGFNVIFKRRPKDLSWEGYNLFENIPNVKIIYEHFEKPGVIDQCDAVITQYGCSSTLNWSMCTNKTVIYADAGWEAWFPDVYALMAKRCKILHYSYDERNRAVFDEGELLRILGETPLQPDYGFVEKYLYPE